jgi:predicted ATP-grasp superfamily ATP-dependent carboligase
MNEQFQDVMSKLSNDVQSSRNDLNISQKKMTDIQESINGLQKNLNSSYLILMTALGIGIAGVVMAAYLLNKLRIKKGMFEGS